MPWAGLRGKNRTPMISAAKPPIRPLVFLGHPGHELRIHGWLRGVGAEVWVLTDGAGPEGKPRVELSRALLASVGARPGEVFGVCTDSAVYQAILDGDVARFTELAERLARRLAEGGHDALVSDRAEGYNPTHDLCELVSAAAVARAQAATGRAIAHHTFALTGAPDGEEAQRAEEDIVVELAPAEIDAKIAAARAYALAAGGTLLDEVEATLATHGARVFARERLFARTLCLETRFRAQAPFYERHGEARVLAGRYGRVIRFAEHMAPLARALRTLTKA